MNETVLSVILAILSVGVSVFSYYVVIRKKIEEQALDAINSAEDIQKTGAEKMAFAVETVYSIVPAVAKPFISKELVETIIQGIFDKVAEFAEKQK